MKDLETQYATLTNKDKAYYKTKLARARKQYEEHRVRFFKLEDDQMRRHMGEQSYSEVQGLLVKGTGQLLQ